MSAYIRCLGCGENTLDVDTLTCDCGYGDGAEVEEDELEARLSTARNLNVKYRDEIAHLRSMLRSANDYLVSYHDNHRYRSGTLRKLIGDIDRDAIRTDAPPDDSSVILNKAGTCLTHETFNCEVCFPCDRCEGTRMVPPMGDCGPEIPMQPCLGCPDCREQEKVE